MSRDNPWTKHRQSFWEEKAGSPNLPTWTRVYCLAYGVHRRNGHAPFRAGEVALAVQIVDRRTGELKKPTPSQVSHAIRTAVDYGFLHRDSTARCLVVPPWAIEGGVRAAEKCCHSEANAGLKVVTQRQPTCHSVTTDNAVTCTDVESLYDSSSPHPGTQGNQEPAPLHRRAAS